MRCDCIIQNIKKMIAVIADDFTGAAEIGGVGVRYGLRVLIETVVNGVYDVDLLVIATDTRSMGAVEASSHVTTIMMQLMKLNPEFIYKKIDSVLRGHVAEELEAMMLQMGRKKALVVAPNPLVGRKIEDGTYFVDGVPLDQTFFTGDPDFPVRSARVMEIIQSNTFPVYSLDLLNDIPSTGIFMANVINHGELKKWAEKIDNEVIVAGGSGFFDAILETKFQFSISANQPEFSFGENSLFIFGSLFPKSQSLLKKFDNKNMLRSNMPESIYYSNELAEALVEEWAIEVADKLQEGFSVMVTIDYPPSGEEGLSCRIRECIGQLVARIADRFELTDLFIEGGATTSMVLKYLEITKLEPFYEADFGVIQMRPEGFPGLCITTKPGSYQWPENLEF